MPEKPTAAFVLSLIGGIFILLGGLLFGAFGAFIAFFFPALGVLLMAIGLLTGVLVLLGAIMLYARPEQHVTWGIIVLIFSLASIISLGGFIIGMVLGVVGGALGIAWKPGEARAPTVGETRTCLGCGRQISLEFNVCPHCGTPAPSPPITRAGGVPPPEQPPSPPSEP